MKAARTFNQIRQARDARVRDAMRERDAARINDAVLTIVAEEAERMSNLRKREPSTDTLRELDGVVEVVDWGIRTFASYVGAFFAVLVHGFSSDVHCLHRIIPACEFRLD